MERVVRGGYTRQPAQKAIDTDPRIGVLMLVFLGVVVLIGGRLAMLMLFQHDYYTALAAGAHEIYETLVPTRGEVFMQDSRTGEEYPFAINRDYFLMYADTREITDDDTAEYVAQSLTNVLGYSDEEKFAIYLKINKRDDPYEPIEQKLDQTLADQIRGLDLPGIGFIRRPFRYYPEQHLGAQVIGFIGKDTDGNDVGSYGVEGYWQEELAGSGGFFEGTKSAGGGLISLAGLSVKEPVDGADMLLTIDRTLQHKACEILRRHMIDYEAASASLVIMDPHSGAIRAMCSLPDFDPNIYNKVESISVYNNTNIFVPYEPGSIFKPVTMAAALNEEKLTPETPYYDSGVYQGACDTPIRNAGNKSYKDTTMTGVLENSINTGMVAIADMVGKHTFRDYIERFGFGVKEGIELDSEVTGTIESLWRNKKDKVDCYTVTASFGQGLTATPLQMVAAYTAIANGGTFMKPYVVEEVRYSDGRLDRTKPTEVRKVLSTRAASLLSGMLVNVIDSGQAGGAAVPGYYIAGKTGTAQIPGPGGYTEETNHSFVGFGPVEDPRFVMIVKFEKPQRKYSASTAAPAFGEVAKFLLDYYRVSPGR